MRGDGALGRAALRALGLAAVLALLAAAPAGGQGRFLDGHVGGQAYRLYVPGAVAEPPGEAPAVPLVLALHGCWQTPEDFARGTRLNEAAERRGLLVLYPAQSPYRNPSRCWNWFEAARAGGGEVGEILALVRRVLGEHRVRRDRVVVVGFSAGGFMAVNLACVAPRLIAGVGVAAGGPYRCGVGLVGGLACLRGRNLDGAASAGACRRVMGAGARAVPATLWHGGGDTVVSEANLDALAVMFAVLNDAVSTVTQAEDGVVRAVYRDARRRAVVETWRVPEMGHAWSGGDPRGTNTYPPGPDATERMLDFLVGRP